MNVLFGFLGLGGFELSFILLIFLFGVLGTIFWLWMLIDCAINEPKQGNEKILWILVILFAHWIGALIYFELRRRKRLTGK